MQPLPYPQPCDDPSPEGQLHESGDAVNFFSTRQTTIKCILLKLFLSAPSFFLRSSH